MGSLLFYLSLFKQPPPGFFLFLRAVLVSTGWYVYPSLSAVKGVLPANELVVVK